MKAAYFDCVAGASGDMILGALVDAGLSLADLQRELLRLSLPPFSLSARRERRAGLAGTRVLVEVPQAPARHIPFGHLLQVVEEGPLPEAIARSSLEILRRLGEAEARAHGTTLEQVELHDMGLVDTAVDVVGAVLGLDMLSVSRVYCSALPSGGGTVSGSEGKLPVPAPAALGLMAAARAPIRLTPGLPHELVTPTGAAILTTLASFEAPALTLERVGYGLGQRDLGDYPNCLRLWLGEMEVSHSHLRLLETNIDDMSPEVYGWAMERLLALGARDVWFTPVQMKKNRPAVVVSVLAPAELESQVVEFLLRETSTLGVRVQEMRRHEAQREGFQFVSSLGLVTVKVKRLDGAVVGLAPEYEECRSIALARGIPLRAVYQTIEEEALRSIDLKRPQDGRPPTSPRP